MLFVHYDHHHLLCVVLKKWNRRAMNGRGDVFPLISHRIGHLTFSMRGFMQCSVSWMYWFSSGWHDIWESTPTTGYSWSKCRIQTVRPLNKPTCRRHKPARARCISFFSEIFRMGTLRVHTKWGVLLLLEIRIKYQQPLEKKEGNVRIRGCKQRPTSTSVLSHLVQN